LARPTPSDGAGVYRRDIVHVRGQHEDVVHSGVAADTGNGPGNDVVPCQPAYVDEVGDYPVGCQRNVAGNGGIEVKGGGFTLLPPSVTGPIGRQWISRVVQPVQPLYGGKGSFRLGRRGCLLARGYDLGGVGGSVAGVKGYGVGSGNINGEGVCLGNAAGGVAYGYGA